MRNQPVYYAVSYCELARHYGSYIKPQQKMWKEQNKWSKTKQTGMRPRLSIAHGIQILMHYICQTEGRDVSLKVCINTYRQQRRHISSLWFLVSLFLIYSFPPHLHNLTRQLNALQQSWKSFHSEIFDLDFFFAICSEHGYSEQPQNHHKTGYDTGENERTREGLTCGRDTSAKAGKINKADGERIGSLPCLSMHDFALHCVLCAYSLQTCKYVFELPCCLCNTSTPYNYLCTCFAP